MARRPLTLADVLREELKWIRAEDPNAEERWSAAEWKFTPRDIYEPLVFLGKIERSSRCDVVAKVDADRYATLATRVASSDVHEITAAEAAERLSRALSELISELNLCEQLLAFPDFRRKIDGSRLLLHLILTDPELRRQYTEGDGGVQRLAELLKHRERLQAALDDGEGVAELLWHHDVRDAVRHSPQLLGAIIDSPSLREALEDSSARTHLRRAFGPPRRWERSPPPVPAPRDPAEVLKVIRPEWTHPPMQKPIEGARFRANALLLEAAFDAHLHDHRDESAMLKRFNQQSLVALCLSGGGIRSATFNLGVLQGLARRGLLAKIDYLSTVSGGGYIGSWLSSWIRRHGDGMEGVAHDLAATSVDPLDPEPGPVGHLREYSNYLAPRPGLFGPDLWSIFATYARNLLLNWTMLLPPLIVLLIVPRFYEWWILLDDGDHGVHVWIGRFFLAAAMGVLAFIRPAGDYVPGKKPDSVGEIRRRRKTVGWFVVFACLAAWFLTAAWAMRGDPAMARPDARAVFYRSLWLFAWANGISSLIYLFRYYRQLRHSDYEQLNVLDRRRGFGKVWRFLRTRVGFPKILLEVLASSTATLAGAGLVYLGARLVPAEQIRKLAGFAPEQYTIGAIPLFLLVLFVESTLLVGIVTLVSGDLEREWWARAAAVTLLAGVGWLLVALLAIAGPMLLTQLPRIIPALGGVAGLVALVRGHGSKTELKQRPPEWKARLLATAAIAALIVIVSGLSLLVSKVLTGLASEEKPVAAAKPFPAEITGTVSLPPGHAIRVERPAPSRIEAMLVEERATRRHIDTLRSGDWDKLLSVFGIVVLIAVIAAYLFDVNTYSMHGMYRNRLIRAYLGASRWFRRPEPFTGFDPQDDLLMAQLRPEYLWSTSFHDLDGFLRQLQQEKESLFTKLPKRVQTRINDFLKLNDRGERDELRNETMTVVFGSINQMMRTTDLVTGRAAAPTIETLRLNRDYLEQRFRKFIRPRSKQTPLHVINIALNLVRGDNLAWQERKAESFTVSPLHAGAAVERLAFRDSIEYGGPNGISLGTAMAISGAAVSANMGYNSSSTVTALMTLFNARLGWWLGNPVRSSYRFAGPRFALWPLLDEAIGNTNDESKYVFLSDGGHFENLGLYEMVRRRCRRIIVCDAAEDPNYAFGDLANAVRKIRIDLGIPIEFTTFSLGPDPKQSEQKRDAAYCAIGNIRYKAASSPTQELEDGWLVYIKPVVYPGDAPIDIMNYSREAHFPQESTADQFFSETQFESYRELGAHIIGRLAEGNPALTPEQFFERLIARYGLPPENAAAPAPAAARANIY